MLRVAETSLLVSCVRTFDGRRIRGWQHIFFSASWHELDGVWGVKWKRNCWNTKRANLSFRKKELRTRVKVQMPRGRRWVLTWLLLAIREKPQEETNKNLSCELLMSPVGRKQSVDFISTLDNHFHHLMMAMVDDKFKFHYILLRVDIARRLSSYWHEPKSQVAESRD